MVPVLNTQAPAATAAPVPAATAAPAPAPTPAPTHGTAIPLSTSFNAFALVTPIGGFYSIAVPSTPTDPVTGDTLTTKVKIGFIIQLTDSNGNKFTSIVTKVNSDGTVEFADKVVCGKDVDDCNFAAGAAIAFWEGSDTGASFQKAYQPAQAGCTPATPCASGVGDCDTNADCAGALVCVPSPDGMLSGGGNADYCGAAADHGHAGKGPEWRQKGGKGQNGGKGGPAWATLESARQMHATKDKWAVGVIGVLCFAVGVVIATHKLGGASEQPNEVTEGSLLLLRAESTVEAPKQANPTSPTGRNVERL